MKKADIGLIGLAVMGQNLVLNMERNGFRMAVYNRTAETTRAFMDGAASGKNIRDTYALSEFVASLKKPRRLMIMVKAGPAVDSVIEGLLPYLEKDDLVIDGGNSYYQDSERRSQELAQKGITFLGVGVSGGEEGALWGPSIMPGGQRQAYDLIEPVYTAISAKVKGDPCLTYIGPRGAGHYVKMVHNGIEYGDMQLIAEAYDLLHKALGLQANELHRVFKRWNKGVLSSFLIEITAEIFKTRDPDSGNPLVEMILDQAGQKGTGRWTIQEALELGYPVPTLSSALEARTLSAFKAERVAAAKYLPGPSPTPSRIDLENMVEAVGHALYASKICAYAQGMGLLHAASREYDYDLNLSEIARIWRGGCIIRAEFLEDVRTAYKEQPDLANLLLAPFFRDAVALRQLAWREVLAMAANIGIPTPAMSASLAYYDAYRSERLPANLIQAQRDYFGAHTYQRIDREGNFHTEWSKHD